MKWFTVFVEYPKGDNPPLPKSARKNSAGQIIAFDGPSTNHMKTYKNILPTAKELEIEKMRFRLLDGNDSSVLGGDVPADNASFLGLEELIQTGCDNLKIHSITDLKVHESVHARFRMNMTTGTYKILRVE